MEPFHISDLASEILLFILLHLDLIQLVVCRRVNKQFQEVIDSNQILWRVFEWEQKDQESFRPALDMLDDHSHNSLENVSIQEQKSKDEDLQHLISVLKRSKETLKEVTLKTSGSFRIEPQIVEMVASGSRLRSLVVWNWGSKTSRDSFPLSRLISSDSRATTSSLGQLQLLWTDQDVKADKHLNSLISFAQGKPSEPLECLELISRFSQTVFHLQLNLGLPTGHSTGVFCPNLKVFEGWVIFGVSFFLEAPQLQTLVIEGVSQDDLEGSLPSVEEIWLRNRMEQLDDSADWEPLLRFCPKLRNLKLMEEFVAGFTFRGLLEVLQTRQQMVQDGKEIDGIKIVSLQKLILPTGMLNEEELERATEVAEEVIDVKDYPEFIEIQY